MPLRLLIASIILFGSVEAGIVGRSTLPRRAVRTWCTRSRWASHLSSGAQGVPWSRRRTSPSSRSPPHTKPLESCSFNLLCRQWTYEHDALATFGRRKLGFRQLSMQGSAFACQPFSNNLTFGNISYTGSFHVFVFL